MPDRHQITPAHRLINTQTGNFHLGSNNLISENWNARFLVESISGRMGGGRGGGEAKAAFLYPDPSQL